MTNLKLDDLQHSQELSASEMKRIIGGDKKEPAGRPIHIDAQSGVLTFKDGSKWTMDLDGKLHPL
ncbi:MULTISPECIES: hypothetical protein [Caballeronia]|jgi:hypothetical protein|uniref:Uncharacterized protein n=1 Tax=Caballeronia zhejiangensis TaxID=871203 RepID=A0A656QSE3_9BURK|nr:MULTISPECIES: hypothetical protein [Caballeronia]EKS69790.1 hypothetical protein BURK_016970 [Burkholderia sp. SJ98]KDR32482.1 hypothetical protein BG60_20645 [Caballeronia zhejiangensis]MCG7401197.1 hypothetical protein [Caballeronia zhejiangensis]MCI1044488.1 hypothetical protein [Caballeronia zhejiangensis]MDR5767383.1 hypothetical protein [Caballeronia sp. LZ028]